MKSLSVKLPPKDVMVARIARCIGIWETNRGGDNPKPTGSRLDTVAGIHASMSTVEQATMPYAVTAFARDAALRAKASPALSVAEINAATACCKSVVALLKGVSGASKAAETPDAFIQTHGAAIAAALLSPDDVRTMFQAIILKGAIDKLHAQVASGKMTLAKAVASISLADRMGLGTASLKIYISISADWGENAAAWQRKAVLAMPSQVGARVEAVAVSNKGLGLVISVVTRLVGAALKLDPGLSEQQLVSTVAQQNNPNEGGYAKNVLAIYTRLFSSRPKARKVVAMVARTTSVARSAARVQGSGRELSGSDWVSRFPDARTTQALADSFRPGCEAFIAAMRGGGATVQITSTRRPVERAYLMYTCWRISKKTVNPQNAKPMAGVDIEWVHRMPDGSVDLNRSRQAATAMTMGYDIAFAPALKSRHVTGDAIDMSISWEDRLVIAPQAPGKPLTISSMPRDGFNLDLRKVGKTYGVIKHPTDPPHWSTDGR